jgi:hypothetical protein
MSMFVDSVRLRLRSIAEQALALDQLLAEAPEMDLGPVEQAECLLKADRLRRRLEALADGLGAAVGGPLPGTDGVTAPAVPDGTDGTGTPHPDEPPGDTYRRRCL